MDEREMFQKHGPLPLDGGDPDLKTILLWTHFYHSGDWSYEFGREFGRTTFIAAGCKENRCRITNEKGLEPISHAIVFHRW